MLCLASWQAPSSSCPSSPVPRSPCGGSHRASLLNQRPSPAPPCPRALHSGKAEAGTVALAFRQLSGARSSPASSCDWAPSLRAPPPARPVSALAPPPRWPRLLSSPPCTPAWVCALPRQPGPHWASDRPQMRRLGSRDGLPAGLGSGSPRLTGGLWCLGTPSPWVGDAAAPRAFPGRL